MTFPKRYIVSLIGLFLLSLFIISALCAEESYAKEYKKDHAHKGNLCIQRFETSGEPLYYSCPRANESEKKSYCCYLDKCCDYKEFQRQTEQQFKMTQGSNYGYIAKGAIGSALRVLLWIVFLIILLIVGCCCLTIILCRKKKLFQGGIFSAPLPAQPPGPSPYAPPSNPYKAYQWPPETASGPQPPPAYPTPSYPPYPSAPNGVFLAPYNLNFK